jgi:hypothetical protein
VIPDGKKDRWRDAAQATAERVKRETGAAFTIVLVCDLDTTVVGAWVPDVSILAALLRNALASLDHQTATIVDKRKIEGR